MQGGLYGRYLTEPNGLTLSVGEKTVITSCSLKTAQQFFPRGSKNGTILRMNPISPSRHGGSFIFALSKQLLGLGVQHCCIFSYIPYRCGAGEEIEQIKINDMWRAQKRFKGIVRNGVLVSHQKSTPDTLVWKTGQYFA